MKSLARLLNESPEFACSGPVVVPQPLDEPHLASQPVQTDIDAVLSRAFAEFGWIWLPPDTASR